MSAKLVFNEKPSQLRHVPKESWKILVVDDDADVHEATEFAMKGEIILGKSLLFLHAYSGAECLDILSTEQDVAVVLMDAVMERNKSGLEAVRSIREDLKMKMIRIILRTGQPGDIPELDTIHLYDINDYKTKSELTRSKLMTTVITAVRSYNQLLITEEGRQGLENIIEVNKRFHPDLSLEQFGSEVLQQTMRLFHLSLDGYICRSRQRESSGDITIIAASGKYQSAHGFGKGDSLSDKGSLNDVRQTFNSKKSQFQDNLVCLYFSDKGEWAYVVYLATKFSVDKMYSLLNVFSSNLSLAAENLRLYSRMERLAFEDIGLEIPNLSALIREIDLVRNHSDKNLYLIDINQFGILNDMLGHDFGDLVLESVIRRLKESFPDNSFIARVSGDVFGIIADDIDMPVIQGFFRKPIPVAEGSQQISVSIGYLSLDEEPLSGSDCLKNAHIALKRAKSVGTGKSVRYNPQIGLETRERIRLLQELRAAFTHEQMFLMFQPQVLLEGDVPIGFEALLRWRNPEGVFVPPSEFIPLAEQGGLIVAMGTWILRMALYTLSDLHNEGFTDLQMAINVSAIQLKNPEFLTILKKALFDSAVNPHKVELEITESVAVMGVENVVRLFHDIKDLGVSIAIDDFGTGYSSLSSIDRWPADRLKIDRSFISGITEDMPGGRIVDLVIPLGKKLGMKVLAEGIETPEQAAHLKELGCLEAQGYLYSKPLLYKDAVSWLKKKGK